MQRGGSKSSESSFVVERFYDPELKGVLGDVGSFFFTVCTKNQDAGADKILLFLQKSVFFSPRGVAEKRCKKSKKNLNASR